MPSGFQYATTGFSDFASALRSASDSSALQSVDERVFWDGFSGDTKKMLKLPSKGTMYSPLYGGILSASNGTDPGALEADMKAKTASMASRPLLISTARPRAFLSGEAFLLNPKGSKRSNGAIPFSLM